MNERLPEAFTDRMRQQLADELPAFLRALDEPAVRGIRMNPLKTNESAARYTGSGRIPWERNGYYLDPVSDAGSCILHEAGAYYIQEPGAMIPAAVLNAQPGERILDLCAAPGGKSTQIGCAMQGEGLLVCNEPMPKRAQILSGNIERMGIPNAVVTCARPEELALRWPEGFDAVIADAPCSGEGMFRRDPATRTEWTAEKAKGCAERQREILSAAAGLVRPGGRLVYSTCTYNPAENEDNIRWFCKQFPDYHPEPFALSGIGAPEGIYTCYPHRQRGEGQFTALLRKNGDSEARLPGDRSLPRPDRTRARLFTSAFPYLPEPTHLFGNLLVSLPFAPDLRGIRVYRTGLHLGEIRGKVAVPDHAAALCFRIPEAQSAELSPEEAVRYIAGETVPGTKDGWLLMLYRGLALGWGKGSGGVIKNHYPKGLRKNRCLP